MNGIPSQKGGKKSKTFYLILFTLNVSNQNYTEFHWVKNEFHWGFFSVKLIFYSVKLSVILMCTGSRHSTISDKLHLHLSGYKITQNAIKVCWPINHSTHWPIDISTYNKIGQKKFYKYVILWQLHSNSIKKPKVKQLATTQHLNLEQEWKGFFDLLKEIIR